MLRIAPKFDMMRTFLFTVIILTAISSTAQTFEYFIPIENSGDDAEQEGSFIDLNDLELDLGVSYGEESLIGLYFRSIALDVSSSVDSAIILLTLQQDFDSTLTVNILLEDQTYPASYVDSIALKSDRNFFSESISWTIAAGSKGDQVASPNLSSLLNQILNKNDWSPTSGVNFIIEPAQPATDSLSNEIQIYSYDQSQPTRRPQLMLVTDSANINGIPKNEKLSTVYIYPNPSSDQINIGNIKGVFEVNVFGLNGQLLMHYEGENRWLDISQLNSGIYCMTITQKESTRFVKFVKATH